MSGTRSKLFTRPTIVRSPKPGPTVVITAGIHGTEIAGVIAAKTLKAVRIRRGTVVIYPLVNPMAHLKRIRGNPDLNRTFPRHPRDMGKHPLSRTLFKDISAQHPAWCIDLHEADGLFKLNPKRLGQTVILYPNHRTANIASRVVQRINQQIPNPKHRFTVLQNVLPGSLRVATGKILQCHAVTVETCIQLPLKQRVKTHILMTQSLLKQLRMI